MTKKTGDWWMFVGLVALFILFDLVLGVLEMDKNELIMGVCIVSGLLAFIVSIIIAVGVNNYFSHLETMAGCVQ